MVLQDPRVPPELRVLMGQRVRLDLQGRLVLTDPRDLQALLELPEPTVQQDLRGQRVRLALTGRQVQLVLRVPPLALLARQVLQVRQARQAQQAQSTPQVGRLTVSSMKTRQR